MIIVRMMQPRLSPRLNVGLATLLVWALAAGSVAFWALRLGGGGPLVGAPVAGGPAPGGVAVDTRDVARALGVAGPAPAAPAAEVSGRLALRGVVTHGGGGAALIAVDGKPAEAGARGRGGGGRRGRLDAARGDAAHGGGRRRRARGAAGDAAAVRPLQRARRGGAGAGAGRAACGGAADDRHAGADDLSIALTDRIQAKSALSRRWICACSYELMSGWRAERRLPHRRAAPR